MTRAVILGCAGPALEPAERRFFAEADPLGFILFARNVESPEQLRALTDELRAAVGRDDVPILVDQEGGRVARLGAPHWRAAPAAAAFGHLAARRPGDARRATWLNARLMAADLAAAGITVDCAPVLDLRWPGAHDVIGDRAFAGDPVVVANLGRAMCEGLLAGGVLPVIKHLPGHGRARVDSHAALPVVDAPWQALAATDLRAFAELSDAPWGMTAHVVYSAVDDARPATLSPRVISEVIREEIGFDGVLVSDDLSMRALTGGLRARAEAAMAAGCDLVVHCNGDLREMGAVTEGAGAVGEVAAARLRRAESRRRASIGSDFDAKVAYAQLDALMREG